MNLPNRITSTRLVLSPVFFLLFFIPVWTGLFSTLSVVLLWLIFITIEITDAVDGSVARSRDEVTDMGKLLDPFSDVFSRITYFVCFAVVGILPAWMLMVVLYREFGITFVRLLMFRRGTALAARSGGKVKTLFYFFSAAISLILLTMSRTDLFMPWYDTVHTVAYVIYIVAALLSIASFLDYMRIFRGTPAAEE